MVVEYILLVLGFDGKEEILKAVFMFEVDFVLKSLEGCSHLTTENELVIDFGLREVNFEQV